MTPAIDRTFPLEEASDAMRSLVASQVRGKLVLLVVGHADCRFSGAFSTSRSSAST